ncbi:MAG TPA: S1-like domain-containing RNA-binding protein [Verrucomicrobiae bacterium]
MKEGLMASIGRRNTLKIIREAPPGLYLDGGELGEILLPRKYIPRDLKPKDLLNVFVYLDSEDRLVATTETPLAEVGEFAALKVIGVNRNVGAFLDWGLAKDLLLPFREQTKPLRIGQKIVVFILLDETSKRIVASARLNRHLSQQAPEYQAGQSVNILIVNKTPLGYNAMVENSHRGLLFGDRTNAPLEVGQRLKAYIREIRIGGKIDLTLDPPGAYKQIPSITGQILEALEKNNGKLNFDDSTAPETIRAKFNVSKNTFKRALSSLYKKRRIRFTNPGIELVAQTDFNPGRAAKR